MRDTTVPILSSSLRRTAACRPACAARIPRRFPPGDYLSLGSWLYVPPDVTDVAAFEIGVFAAGRDPFAEDNLLALTGTATYIGKAAGTYADRGAPGDPSFLRRR